MRGQWRNNLFPGVGRDDSARRLGGLYCFAGVFRRLRAASSFASGGKGTKTPPGDGSGWTLRVHIRLSPDPITGDALLFDVAEFPARKNGVASALPSGPLGPGFAKIAAGAVQKLRLGFPNQRSRCWIRRRGGPCGRPRWIRNQLSVLFVGAAISRPQAFPLQGGRCPQRGRMRVPSWLARPPAGGPKAPPTPPRKGFLKNVGEGLAPPAGRSGTGPYERRGRLRGERGGTLL